MFESTLKDYHFYNNKPACGILDFCTINDFTFLLLMILPLSLLCRKKNAHMLLFQYFNMNNKQSGNLPRASGEEGIKYIRVSDIAIYRGNPQYYFLYTIFFLCVISFDTLTLIR